VQTLAGVFGRVKKQPGALAELRNQRQVGAKSIEAVVKIAAKSQSVVQLHHRTADGETIDLKVTPVEAIQIRENAKVARASLPSPRSQTLARLPGENSPPISYQPALFPPSDYAGILTNAYTRLDAKGGSAADTDVRPAVAALSQSLISAGLGSLVSEIASSLEVQGHYDLAQMLRAELRSQNPEQSSG
jgi:hypothetical protein